jgi:uncharacterized protein (DUF427 family)
MGLSWQQGPLAPGAVGRFLVPDPLPRRLLFAEPLRRRMRVRFGGAWIADSEDVVLLHEPGRYPVAYFPVGDIADGVLQPSDHTTEHAELGPTSWYAAQLGEHSKPRAAWQHTSLPSYASDLKGRVAFAWRAMDAFYEEDERIVGHAADSYHRIDIRQTSRHLTVQHDGRDVADTTRPLVLYESGFAPRWYVPRDDIDMSALTPARGQTFCPYKGLASYYDVTAAHSEAAHSEAAHSEAAHSEAGYRAAAHRAAWSYEDAWAGVERISGLVSFEPDKVAVELDGTRMRLEPGQSVLPHGIDRDLTIDQVVPGGQP